MQLRYIMCTYLTALLIIINLAACGQSSNKAAKKDNTAPTQTPYQGGYDQGMQQPVPQPSYPYPTASMSPGYGVPTSGLMGMLPTLLGALTSPGGSNMVTSLVGGVGSLLTGGIGGLLSGLTGIIGKLF